MMMMMMRTGLKCMATLDTGNWTPRDIETWLIECSAGETRRERERQGERGREGGSESERAGQGDN